MATPPTGAEFVNAVRRYLGVPYKFGGGPADPFAGLDCSGLVVRGAEDIGIVGCPRTSEQQKLWAEPIKEWEVGALCFFEGSDGEPGSPGHVGIVVTAGQMINAPFTGTVVRQDSFGTNGTGVNLFEGYGRLRGLTPSSSANASLVGTTSDEQTGAQAGGIFGGIIGFVMVAAMGLLLVGGIIVLGYVLYMGSQ